MKKMGELFRYKCISKYHCLNIFSIFGKRDHLNFGKVVFILSVISTASSSAEQSFSV